MVQIPEYNERIIARPESRPVSRLSQPDEFTDVSYLERMNRDALRAKAEQVQIMLDMKKDRDESIANEFLNQYSMAKTEKLNELKDRYKGANAQGIMDEFKRWQEDYYTSHVGFSDAANEGTLYLENKEQMSMARDALLRSTPSDINSLSAYAASELDSYKKNQFTARVQMEAQDIAGETDLENIANKISTLSQTVDEYYAGESPEFIQYVKSKAIDEAMTSNISNIIGSIDSIDSADLAMQWLDGAAKFISNEVYNSAKNQINNAYAREIGITKAKLGSGKKSGGSGKLSTKAKDVGAEAAYADTMEEVATLQNKESEIKESMTSTEQKQFDAIANKAQLEEENKIATEGKRITADICDIVKASIDKGVSSSAQLMLDRLPFEYQDYLKQWQASFPTEAEIEDYNKKQTAAMAKTEELNEADRQALEGAQNYANLDYVQEQISQKVNDDGWLLGATKAALNGIAHSTPFTEGMYIIGELGANVVARYKGLFDKGEVQKKTKTQIEDIDKYYRLKSGDFINPDDYLLVANSIKDPAIRGKALLMDALESKKRVILQNSYLSSTIDNVFNGTLVASSKGYYNTALKDEFRDYCATSIATEIEGGVDSIGINEMERLIQGYSVQFASDIANNNTPVSAVWNIIITAPEKAESGENLLQTKQKHIIASASETAKTWNLPDNKAIIFTDLVLGGNFRAAKTMLEVTRDYGFK